MEAINDIDVAEAAHWTELQLREWNDVLHIVLWRRVRWF